MRLGRGSCGLQTPTWRLEPTWAHLPSPRLAAEVLDASEKPEAPAESWGRAGEEDGRGGRRTWPPGRAPGQGVRQERLVLGRRHREGCQLQLRDAAQAARPRHGRRGRGAARPRWALGSGAARPGWPKQAGRPALGPTPPGRLGRLGPSGFPLGPPLGRGGTGTPAGLQRGHPTDLRAPAPRRPSVVLTISGSISTNTWHAPTISGASHNFLRYCQTPQTSGASPTFLSHLHNSRECPQCPRDALTQPKDTLKSLGTERAPTGPRGHFQSYPGAP